VKITPVDIKNQKFAKSFRGYDSSEVEGFLELVATTMEDLLLENRKLNEKHTVVESTLKSYTNLESNLKDALVTAQKAAEEIRENAKKEAELLMRETRLKAERNLEEAYDAISSIKKQMADLENIKRDYLVRFKSLLDTHRNIIESMEKEDNLYKEEPLATDNKSQPKLNSDREIKL
jgi:cell division initiation protein